MKLFTLDREIHDHDTRYSNFLLHVPEIHSTTYGNKSIKFHGPTIWNDLVRSGFSLDLVHNPYQFKRLLKRHLLSNPYIR